MGKESQMFDPFIHKFVLTLSLNEAKQIIVILTKVHFSLKFQQNQGINVISSISLKKLM